MRPSSIVKPRPPQPRAPEPDSPRRGLVALLFDPQTARSQGAPPLDPRRWTYRHRWFSYAGLAVAAIALMIESVQAGGSSSPTEGVKAFIAVLFGVALIGLALSLRGLTLPGFLLGGLFVAAGILSWAYTDTPKVVWALLVVEGVVFAIWTFPWLRDLARLPRLGGAWLGLAYWFLGVIGALLVWHPTVAAQRIAYAGLFTLGALAVVAATRKSGKDLTIGIAAAFLTAIALLFIVGSGNALDDVHAVPNNAWGAHMEFRFWGGPGLLYHPNSIALVAVVAAIRIAADRAFERWQRLAALAMVTVVLLLENSRTGLLYLGTATLVWVLLVWRAQRARRPLNDGVDTFPRRRSAWAIALLPIVLVGVIGVGSGGANFLTASRYSSAASTGGTDITSGRSSTWDEVWKEFKADDVAQKIFGDAKYARAYVIRDDTGATAASRPKLTTDNSAVGALRRGGILGSLAFVLGLLLLLWHAIRGVRLPGSRRPDGAPATRPDRRVPPAWFTMTAVGALPTIATADWLLGGTGGTLWIFLLAAEAFLLFGPIPATAAGPATVNGPASTGTPVTSRAATLDGTPAPARRDATTAVPPSVN